MTQKVYQEGCHKGKCSQLKVLRIQGAINRLNLIPEEMWKDTKSDKYTYPYYQKVIWKETRNNKILTLILKEICERRHVIVNRLTSQKEMWMEISVAQERSPLSANWPSLIANQTRMLVWVLYLKWWKS